jgi:LEA14-like dessication related protein
MKHVKYLLILIMAINLSSCEVLQQAAELSSFAKCKFRLHTIEDINLAGVAIQNKKSISDFNFIDAAKLTAAMTSERLPLNFVLNVEVKNPNQKKTAMNKFIWQLFIDETEVTQGVLTRRIEISPNGTASLPLLLSVDLKEIFKRESGRSLLNLVFNLVGTGNRPTNISLKAKPTIFVANREVVYPGFITIKNEFN